VASRWVRTSAGIEPRSPSAFRVNHSDPHDRRANLIFLTDIGRALRPASRDAGERVEQDWAAVVGRDDLERLRRTLIRLLKLDVQG
jgi:DNA-binding MarR family transcriptional regulator